MKKIYFIPFLFTIFTAHAADVIGGIDIPNLSSPECMEIKYSPVPIHSLPNKPVIGLLVLDNPEITKEYKPSCDTRPIIQTKINNKINKLETMEISYEHAVPAVYDIQNNWLKLKDKDNFVWIKKKPEWKYVSLENDLVQGIETVQEFCSKTQCKFISKDKQELIKANELGYCYGNVYEVNGKIIKLPDGRKIYPAKMLDDLVPLYGKKLPLKTYIPVYSKNGKWNGFYYSRGC